MAFFLNRKMDPCSKLNIFVTNFTNFLQIGWITLENWSFWDQAHSIAFFSESNNRPMFKIDHFGNQFHLFHTHWMDDFGKLVILRLCSFNCIFSESNNGPPFKIDHFCNQFHQFLPNWFIIPVKLSDDMLG